MREQRGGRGSCNRHASVISARISEYALIMRTCNGTWCASVRKCTHLRFLEHDATYMCTFSTQARAGNMHTYAVAEAAVNHAPMEGKVATHATSARSKKSMEKARLHAAYFEAQGSLRGGSILELAALHIPCLSPRVPGAEPYLHGSKPGIIAKLMQTALAQAAAHSVLVLQSDSPGCKTADPDLRSYSSLQAARGEYMQDCQTIFIPCCNTEGPQAPMRQCPVIRMIQCCLKGRP